MYTDVSVDSTDNSGAAVVKRAFQCTICSHKYMYTNDNKKKPTSTVLLHHMKTQHAAR